VLGGISSFVGFWIAYDYNLPVGPTDVVLLGAVYTLGFISKKIWEAWVRRDGHSAQRAGD
jgi:ABC-type Mn2+/Zn2+ transport system permease subunit